MGVISTFQSVLLPSTILIVFLFSFSNAQAPAPAAELNPLYAQDPYELEPEKEFVEFCDLQKIHRDDPESIKCKCVQNLLLFC